jgi:hypothetical protein
MKPTDRARFGLAMKRLEVFFGKQPDGFYDEYWKAFGGSRIDAVEFAVDRAMEHREKRFGFPLPGDLRKYFQDFRPPEENLLLTAGEPEPKNIELVSKFMRLFRLRMRKKGGLTQEEFARRVKEVTG